MTAKLPDGLPIKVSETNAPAIHLQNDAGDWAKIEHDGTFTCSNPDAVTELAELFWNHLATLGPLFGTGAMQKCPNCSEELDELP